MEAGETQQDLVTVLTNAKASYEEAKANLSGAQAGERAIAAAIELAGARIAYQLARIERDLDRKRG
jgi:hypothetical protein